MFYWAHKREHCGSQPPAEQIVSSQQVVCHLLQNLGIDIITPRFLWFMFVRRRRDFLIWRELDKVNPERVFSNCFMIPIVISILSVMSPRLLLRQRGISLVWMSVWRKKVYLKKEEKHTHTHFVLLCKINLSVLASVTLTGLWVFSPHCL